MLDANAVVQLARERGRDAYDEDERKDRTAPRPGDLDALRDLVGRQEDPMAVAVFRAAFRVEYDEAAFDAWQEESEEARLTMAEGPDDLDDEGGARGRRA